MEKEIIILNDCKKYYGDWIDDVRNGRGIYYYQNEINMKENLLIEKNMEKELIIIIMEINM